MDQRAPLTGRLRGGRLVLPSIVAVVVLGCGSAAGGGGGGGGGGADTAKIVAVAQTAFGTSMISGDVDGATLTITLVDGFGEGGAKLFMCSKVKNAAEQYDPSGTLAIVMVNQSGDQLAALADC